MQQRGLQSQRGGQGCAVPSPAESASGCGGGVGKVQESTSNIHVESHRCCALQIDGARTDLEYIQ